MQEVLRELDTEKLIGTYGQYFKYIEFAVYCRGYEAENYDAFYQTLNGIRPAVV